jgi:Zn-dependent protease with chaperone function
MNPDPTQAVELARQVLPFWVAWGSAMLVVSTAAMVTLASTWVAGAIALRATRGAGDAAWPERARSLYSAKQAVHMTCLFASMLCMALGIIFAGPFSALRPRHLAALGAVVAVVVGLWPCRAVAQRLRPSPIPLADAWRGAATCTLLFFMPYLLLLPALFLIPIELDAGALLTVALTALAIAAFYGGPGLKVGRLLGLITPASGRARSIVAAAAARAGVEPRAVYELRWASANAVAFPLHRAVAFTDGALARLSDSELEAICAHELGHLAEGRWIPMVRVLVAAALAPLALIVPLVAMFGAVGVAPIVLWLLVLLRTWAYVSRRLELRADAAAHGDVGGETYARALERLYEVNLIPAVISGTKTHPCLYDRMLAAGVEPSYPRPAPPAASVPRRALFASIAISFLMVVGIYVSLVSFTCGRWRDPLRLQVSLLLPGTNVAPRLAALAHERQTAADAAAAVKLYRAASDLERDPWSAAAHLAMAFVLDGHCTNARALLAGARKGYCPDCNPSDGPSAALTAETAALVCGTPYATTLSSS